MIAALLILEQGFMLWMLYDAIQRRCDAYWYWIIILPFGEWLYFFSVKINDPGMVKFKGLIPFRGDKPLSMAALRHLATETPSRANKLKYAQALHDNGEFETASMLFDDVLEREPDQRDAILGSGLCLQQLGRFDEASTRFRQLIELDRSCFDYEPWIHLARTQWAEGDREASVGSMRQLVEVSPRLRHRLVLAQLLLEIGEPDEARLVLDSGLLTYEHAPKFLRRNDRGLARQAQKLRRTLV
ncbi:MAG: tetratricopeptide repeat protein [Thermoanaerobaculia bacterium]|nr:tetratricopeptide repeat protein [Thermoanaerobaculia bacterium]